MSCIARMSRRGLICRMGRLGGLIQRCGRIGYSVFFCLERGTSDIQVLRLGLGGVVVSIWRFDRSDSLSSCLSKVYECGLWCGEECLLPSHEQRVAVQGQGILTPTSEGHRCGCPHLSWERVWFDSPTIRRCLSLEACLLFRWTTIRHVRLETLISRVGAWPPTHASVCSPLA